MTVHQPPTKILTKTPFTKALRNTLVIHTPESLKEDGECFQPENDSEKGCHWSWLLEISGYDDEFPRDGVVDTTPSDRIKLGMVIITGSITGRVIWMDWFVAVFGVE